MKTFVRLILAGWFVLAFAGCDLFGGGALSGTWSGQATGDENITLVITELRFDERDNGRIEGFGKLARGSNANIRVDFFSQGTLGGANPDSVHFDLRQDGQVAVINMNVAGLIGGDELRGTISGQFGLLGNILVEDYPLVLTRQ